MKKGIHPENYRLVAFKDMSNEDVFITKSTAETRETITVDGVEYPVVKMEISRTSHPFYTGKSNLLILQDVSINSKRNTLNTVNNIYLFIKISQTLHFGEFFYFYDSLKLCNFEILKYGKVLTFP